jgi:hypothetical protein
MLHDHNTFVQRFKQVMDMPAHDLPQWEVVIKVDNNVDKHRYNAPTAPEVAGLLPGEFLQQHVLLCCLFVAIAHLMQCSSFIDINVVAPAQATVTSRLQAGTLECMHAVASYGGSVTCTLLMIRCTLCYSILMVSPTSSQACPMLLLPLSAGRLLAARRKVMLGMLQDDGNEEPTQDDGSEEEGDVDHVAADAGPTQPAQRNKNTTREWVCYHMHDRNPTSHALFVYGKRLYQEWGVDQYNKVESQRLFYICNNQGPWRAVIYGGVADVIANNDANIDNLGRLIVLPSSFIGGHRHMAQLYQDSMAIVRQYGKTDLFITMTCNPKWEEIVNVLKPGEIANDRPDLVTRVFVGKL